jgi:hypothetical protein
MKNNLSQAFAGEKGAIFSVAATDAVMPHRLQNSANTPMLGIDSASSHTTGKWQCHAAETSED